MYNALPEAGSSPSYSVHSVTPPQLPASSKLLEYRCILYILSVKNAYKQYEYVQCIYYSCSSYTYFNISPISTKCSDCGDKSRKIREESKII